MNDIRKVYQCMERCDAHAGDVRGVGKVIQLTGSLTVIREVLN